MSPSSNPRGEIFEDFISLNNLFVCNIGNKYTYDCAIGKSIIDITIVTNPMVDRIKDWVVHDEDFLSDHKLITFNLNADKGQPLVGRNFKNADWSYFKNYLAKKKCQSSKYQRDSCVKSKRKQTTKIDAGSSLPWGKLFISFF